MALQGICCNCSKTTYNTFQCCNVWRLLNNKLATAFTGLETIDKSGVNGIRPKIYFPTLQNLPKERYCFTPDYSWNISFSYK